MTTDDNRPAVSGDVIDMKHLIVMANQIGDFFASYPPKRAREGLRNHLRINWDPRMRNALLAHIDSGGDGLDVNVIDAVQLLRKAADKSGYYGPPQA
jgi:formate dehydrogenase subunit delta|tara:strand:- start:501 stop:791 length:291 start_codon:yes stop_codon:yes gene_type:complete